MGECLGEIAEGLTAFPGLLSVQPEMVGVAKHLFEDQPRLVQILRVGAAGSRQCLDKPERTDVEGALVAV